MHSNSAFRQATPATKPDFARARGFGILSVNAPQGPLLSHIPFLLSGDGAEAELHLVRSNPIASQPGAPQSAVIAVSGPEGYISPDWYGVPDQVPTWNSIAVHLRGSLERLPHDRLRAMPVRLSAAFEARLAPKAPRTSAKMPDGVMDRVMRAIVPCRFTIMSVDGTWKLNQNKRSEGARPTPWRRWTMLPPASAARARAGGRHQRRDLEHHRCCRPRAQAGGFDARTSAGLTTTHLTIDLTTRFLTDQTFERKIQWIMAISCLPLRWLVQICNMATIWHAQIVMYPLFARVGAADYVTFHRFYVARIPLPVILPGFLSFFLPLAFLVTVSTALAVAMAGPAFQPARRRRAHRQASLDKQE